MKRSLVCLLTFLWVCSGGVARAGLSIGDEDNNAEILGWVRAFYNYRFGAEPGEREANRFAVDQARIGLKGRVLSDFRFEFEVEMGGGEVEAKDFWAAYEPADWFQLRVGQFKVPYSRGRMTRERNQLFTKRADLIQDFVPGRDIGVGIRSRLLEKKLELYTGVFTGNGQNEFRDDGKGKPLVSARVAVSPLGRFRYRAGDLERSPRPKVSFGINLAWSDDDVVDPDGFLRTIEGEKLLYGADVAFKYRGFYAQAEVHHANFWPDEGREFRAGGFMVQAAYLVLAPWLEVAVRYDEFNPTDRVRLNTQRTITYGLNYYVRGHRAKVQVNYFQRLDLDRTGEKWKEDELRVLFQLVL